MAGVGDVAGLVGDDGPPAVVRHQGAQAAGRIPEAVEGRVEGGCVEEGDGAAQEALVLGVGALHAGVLRVRGAVDVLGQEAGVVAEDLVDLQ